MPATSEDSDKESIEDLEMTAGNVVSVAPGEGHKPIGIFTDEHFEEMCNPTKYPGGKFGLQPETS